MKTKRLTFNKKIVAGKTHTQKWQVALTGGGPLSPIAQLSNSAAALRGPSAYGEKWLSEARERLKKEFADLLFPALLDDKSDPFLELLEAMAAFRKHGYGNRPPLPKKVEVGRRLRLGLLSAGPDDLLSSSALRKFLDRHEVEYSDASHVTRTRKKVGVKLLKSGHQLKWIVNGKEVRKVTVLKGGKIKNEGATEQEVSNMQGLIRIIEKLPDK